MINCNTKPTTGQSTNIGATCCGNTGASVDEGMEKTFTEETCAG